MGKLIILSCICFCVIYLMECKLAQAGPFELLTSERCQVHKGAGWCNSWVIRFLLSRLGKTRSPQDDNSHTGLWFELDPFRVFCAWKPERHCFYVPVAKYPRRNKAVSLFVVKALCCPKGCFSLFKYTVEDEKVTPQTKAKSGRAKHLLRDRNVKDIILLC